MKNYIQKGDTLELTAPAGGVVAGTAYKIGDMILVAMVTAAAGEKVSFSRTGVFSLAKESTTAAFAEGEKVYFDSGSELMDEQAVGRFFAGTCVKAAGATDATVEMVLNGFGVNAE